MVVPNNNYNKFGRKFFFIISGFFLAFAIVFTTKKVNFIYYSLLLSAVSMIIFGIIYPRYIKTSKYILLLGFTFLLIGGLVQLSKGYLDIGIVIYSMIFFYAFMFFLTVK